MYITIHISGLLMVQNALRLEHTVVPTDESITIVTANFAIDEFPGLFESDVHVTID